MLSFRANYVILPKKGAKKMEKNVVNFTKAKTKAKVRKLEKRKPYNKPLARCVGFEDMRSKSLTCWNCGEDGIHC